METYDIIVCGAGSAGFCAAVAAARMGAKTALVEKYNTPGGILTVLGNNSIDQFNNPFIADKKMVITGIGWELVLRLHKEGYARIPDMNAPRENHVQYGVKVILKGCEGGTPLFQIHQDFCYTQIKKKSFYPFFC